MSDKKDLQSMLKDAMILFAITLIAGILLGFVYELTKEPIRLQQEKAIREACQEVFAEAENFKEISYVPSVELLSSLKEDGVTIGTAYQAVDANGAHLGFVVESTSSEGYGGNITLYVGIREDGTLNGISILEISETPGLGMKAEEVLAPQFAGKQESSFVFTKTGSKSDQEIDAISGATVTTEAVTNAVNGGLAAAADLAESIGKGGNADE